MSKKSVFLVQKHCFQPFLVGQNFHICLLSGQRGLTHPPTPLRSAWPLDIRFITTPLIPLAQCAWTFLNILWFHSVEKDVAIVKICVNSVLLVASLIGLYAAVMSTRLYHHHFQHICFNTIITTPMAMIDFDYHDHWLPPYFASRQQMKIQGQVVITVVALNNVNNSLRWSPWSWLSTSNITCHNGNDHYQSKKAFCCT